MSRRMFSPVSRSGQRVMIALADLSDGAMLARGGEEIFAVGSAACDILSRLTSLRRRIFQSMHSLCVGVLSRCSLQSGTTLVSRYSKYGANEIDCLLSAILVMDSGGG